MHSRQEMEPAQMAIIRKMDKENVVYAHSRLWGYKEKLSHDICIKMDATGDYCVQQSNSTSKNYHTFFLYAELKLNYMHMYVCACVYIYVYTCIYMCM